MPQLTFEKELESLLNRYSKENDGDTPDWILAEYLMHCLAAYNSTVQKRDNFFGVDMWSENKLKKQQP